MKTSHLRASVAAVVVALAASGCSLTDGTEGPAVPSPEGRAAGLCRTLHGELPSDVDGQQRNTDDPKSKYTAAWGDPATELRCGVPRPEKLSPGSEHYNPTTEAAEVNGVSWLIEQQEDGYRFTTTDRAANIELTVPDDYAPEIGTLTELAAAVKKTVPVKQP